MGDWLAIGIIGLATYAFRVLPLLSNDGRSRKASADGRGRLNALGLCLLTAMAVTVLLPEIGAAVAQDRLPCAIAGMLAVVAVMAARRDPGLATLAGVAGWWLMA